MSIVKDIVADSRVATCRWTKMHVHRTWVPIVRACRLTFPSSDTRDRTRIVSKILRRKFDIGLETRKKERICQFSV